MADLGTENRTSSNLQKATHAVGGFEIDLLRNFSVNIESYWKSFDQLVVVNRNKLNATDPNYTSEDGVAYGGDISLKV